MDEKTEDDDSPETKLPRSRLEDLKTCRGEMRSALVVSASIRMSSSPAHLDDPDLG